MIRLQSKSSTDMAVWLETMWSHYYDELLGAGFTAEEATQNVEHNKKNLFDDGAPNDAQRIFDVIDDDVAVGSLWLARRGEGNAGEWFIYDIVIDENYRGRGLGRSTMLAAEEYVRGEGGSRLALNVFGPNTVARRLYESLGYSTLAIGMRKDLDSSSVAGA
ncbi:MAG: GNAT family N-acetyltransferase [Acidimicrobiales bacterium]